MNNKTLKILGIVTTVVGFGLTMAQKQLEDKKLEELISKEVQKKLNNQ